MAKSLPQERQKRVITHARYFSTTLWDGPKPALEDWLLQRPEEDPTFLPFTNIVALPARRRLPGENPTWHSKTGEVTTQPPRKSREQRARDAITRFEEQTGWRSPAPGPSTHTQSGVMQPYVGNSGSAHGNPFPQDPGRNNPSGAPAGLGVNSDYVDPRVLQRNPDSDGMSAFTSTSNTPPPLAVMDQPLEGTGLTQPERNTENQPLAGYSSPPVEAEDGNVDDIFRELLNFESDGEEKA